MTSSAVSTFNSLPRPTVSPSKMVTNHWHFTVRHVPLQPPGDLVFFVNPPSGNVHAEGPEQILSLPTAAAKADVIVPFLLKAFINNIGTHVGIASPSAPWSWATDDEQLARAVETKLKELGVKEELCTVITGRSVENMISEREWARVLGTLVHRRLGVEGAKLFM